MFSLRFPWTRSELDRFRFFQDASPPVVALLTSCYSPPRQSLKGRFIRESLYNLRLSTFVPDALRFDRDSRLKAYRESGVIGELDEHFGTIAAIFVDGAVADHLTSEFRAFNHIFLVLLHHSIAEHKS